METNQQQPAEAPALLVLVAPSQEDNQKDHGVSRPSGTQHINYTGLYCTSTTLEHLHLEVDKKSQAFRGLIKIQLFLHI